MPQRCSVCIIADLFAVCPCKPPVGCHSYNGQRCRQPSIDETVTCQACREVAAGSRPFFKAHLQGSPCYTVGAL